MAEKPKQPLPGRGRGAAMQALLQKRKEEMIQQTIEGTGEGAVCNDARSLAKVPIPPRGRAAMRARITEKLDIRPGTSTVETPSVSSVTETLSITSLKEAEPCRYQGTSGKALSGACNYISLTTMGNDRGVHEYAVKFAPAIDSKSVRIQLVNEFVGRTVRMFDGGYVLYLPQKLEKFDYVTKNPFDATSVKLTFIYVKTKKLGECIHMFNVLFKRIMRVLQMNPIGRSYFDCKNTVHVPQHRLEILPGYAVSVEEQEGGVMVCLDTQHRVLRTVSVKEHLLDLQTTVAPRDLHKVFADSILGTSVQTKYNNKTYQVDDVLWSENPTSTFDTHDGGKISYVDYYLKQYGIQIKDLKQPLLVNTAKKRISGSEEMKVCHICLIPELCYMTGLSDSMRKDFNVMKDLATHTRISPLQRMDHLRTYVNNVNSNSKAKQILEDWGLELKNSTVALNMRTLDPETIFLGDNVEGSTNNGDFGHLVNRNKVLTPVDLHTWIVFYTARDQRVAELFAEAMPNFSRNTGMRISRPKLIKLPNDYNNTYASSIRENISPGIQIMVFITPTQRDDRYSVIKSICCAQTPIATQYIHSRTLANPKKANQIIQKIALQINCKIGGSLWTVRIPAKNWMIIGIDVYHSPTKNKSVCAVVCSLNGSLTRWYSTVIFQDTEMSDQLRGAFAKLLEKYREVNGTFPSNVIVYRDGVGDGQLSQCKDHEVVQFQKCLDTYNFECKLTVIIVQKRINTRLFLNRGDNYENPLSGTIVDENITRRNWNDFFLVPQSVRQGTVTPTHYIVLSDAAKMKPDHIQRLSYKLCHLYYNWPGTIRVPAPCQYAHKLAYLVGQHICKMPSSQLCDRLFYL